MLGRQPALGRTFTPQELQTAVIVSNRFWQSRLGGDPNVLGTVLTIQDHPRTIVGVMPPDFVFPYKSMLGPSGFLRTADVEAWLPLEFVDRNDRSTGVATLTRSARFLSVVGRLKPGATVTQANAELSGIAKQLAASFPESNRVVGASVIPLHEQAVGALRPALVLLLGGVGFVLLIACVNLAEPAARAQQRPRARDGDSRGARRRTPASDRADARRNDDAGVSRRGRRHCRRQLEHVHAADARAGGHASHRRSASRRRGVRCLRSPFRC